MGTKEIFTVRESRELLRAIFPRYPDLRGMKEIPEIGVFLLELRSQSLAAGELENLSFD